MVWDRKIEIDADGAVIVCDEVPVQSSKVLSFIFNLHPEVEVNKEGNALILSNNRAKLCVTLEGTCPINTEHLPGKAYIHLNHCENRRITLSAELGHAVSVRTVIKGGKA